MHKAHPINSLNGTSSLNLSGAFTHDPVCKILCCSEENEPKLVLLYVTFFHLCLRQLDYGVPGEANAAVTRDAIQ